MYSICIQSKLFSKSGWVLELSVFFCRGTSGNFSTQKAPGHLIWIHYRDLTWTQPWFILWVIILNGLTVCLIWELCEFAQISESLSQNRALHDLRRNLWIESKANLRLLGYTAPQDWMPHQDHTPDFVGRCASQSAMGFSRFTTRFDWGLTPIIYYIQWYIYTHNNI